MLKVTFKEYVNVLQDDITSQCGFVICKRLQNSKDSDLSNKYLKNSTVIENGVLHFFNPMLMKYIQSIEHVKPTDL